MDVTESGHSLNSVQLYDTSWGGMGGVSFVVVVVVSISQKFSFLFEDLKCFQHLYYIEIGAVLLIVLRCFILNTVVWGHILLAFTAKNMMLQIISSGNYFIGETVVRAAKKEMSQWALVSSSILFHMSVKPWLCQARYH